MRSELQAALVDVAVAGDAAVEDQDCAVHVRAVGGQEQGGIGDLFGLAPAVQGSQTIPEELVVKALKDAVLHYIPDEAERKVFLENMFYYNACKVFGVEP